MIEQVRFQVSLSNGETLQEGVGILEEVAGELSPWNKLLQYQRLINAEIVSLCLITKDGRTFNLPSAGKNPSFKPFRVAEKPISYKVQRAVGSEHKFSGKSDQEVPQSSLTDFYTIAVAVYTEYEMQLWVSEINTFNCWTVLVNKKELEQNGRT